MPQLDFSTYTPQLFWLVVWFVILYVLMAKVGLPRIVLAIETRRQRRDDDLGRAAQMKAAAEAANAAFQQTMAEARGAAQALIKEAVDQFAVEAAQRQRALAAVLAEQIATAEQRIAATKDEALSEVRGIAIDVGRAVVEKLTGSVPNPATLAAAVDSSLAGQVPGRAQ